MNNFISSIFGSGSKPTNKPPQSPKKQQNNNNNNNTSRRQSVSPVPSQQQQQQQQRTSTARNSTFKSQQQNGSSIPPASPKCGTPSKLLANNNNNNTNQQQTKKPSGSNNNMKAPLSPRPCLSSASSLLQFSNTNNGSAMGSLSQGQQQYRSSTFSTAGATTTTSSGGPSSSYALPTRDAIKVTVRVRPAYPKENLCGENNNNNNYISNNNTFAEVKSPTSIPGNVLICDDVANQLFVEGRHEPFAFQRVLSPEASQLDCYNITTKPLLDEAMKGFNSCLFAFGQSSSGKTYSMVGDRRSYTSNACCIPSAVVPVNVEDSAMDGDNAKTKVTEEDDDEEKYPFIGMIPRLCKDLFSRISVMNRQVNENNTTNNNNNNKTWVVSIGFIEIYNEQVFDLLDASYTSLAASFSNNANNNNALLAQLNGKGLEVREDTSTNRFYVEKQTFVPVSSAEQIQRFMEKGLNARRVAETCMNERSSRSHALFQLVLEEVRISNNNNNNNNVNYFQNEPPLKSSKINLVDLAGSENAKKTEAQGQQKVEGGHINKSLLALRQVIDERAQNNSFVSYRNSVLTKLLKDSLGGNSKTAMLACVSPLEQNKDETMNTLRYASKAANIVNSVRVNERNLLLGNGNNNGVAQSQYQQQVVFLSKNIQELEQKLEGFEKIGAAKDFKVAALERDLASLRNDLQDRMKLYKLQQDENEELERQLEKSKLNEHEAFSATADACNHFRVCEDAASAKIEILRKEQQQDKKRWESSKQQDISRLEKELQSVRDDSTRAQKEYFSVLESLRSEFTAEKNVLLENLRQTQEAAKAREEELQEKIDDLRRSHENEIAVLNGMYRDQMQSLNQDSASGVSLLHNQLKELETSKEQQESHFRETLEREARTVSHLQSLIVKYEAKIKNMGEDKNSQVQFYMDRNKELEQTVARLQDQLRVEREEREKFICEHIANASNNSDGAAERTEERQDDDVLVPAVAENIKLSLRTPPAATRRRREEDDERKENNEEADLF